MNQHILPRVFVDFNNVDTLHRVRLNCLGTTMDLNLQGVILQSEVKLTLYQDEMEIEGTIVFSELEGTWVAKVDWLNLVEKNTQMILNKGQVISN